ncbi:uncharacterized protein LOC126570255 isoform X2 [Anopheles aquasalis]|uniref:uncharacterized protein LOC126570255 isoform X2 n=1 Tax=Anopheles aquasalis TaxID=42839 RepID=UPI00215B29DF|nr:uncharacterized protein LOC126570255 isoform X2 [Anopheles aquasalis]
MFAVNYEPEDDEHAGKNKNKNGYYGSGAGEGSAENNNAPICRQPRGSGAGGSIGRNMSMSSACKIHEDDLRREIQTNVPMLAPEVMAIFANSQIFQSNTPPAKQQQQTSKATSPASVKFAISDSGSPIDVTPAAGAAAGATATDDVSGRAESSDKLLKRLEGPPLDERDHRTTIIPAIVEEEDSDEQQERDDEVVLRPPRNFSDVNLMLSKSIPRDVGTSVVGKQQLTSHLQAEVPYFAIRPASENDIFTISSTAGGGSGGPGTYNAISMTPEVPAISYSNLPKNYLETPVIEKYRESVSLYSIQTAGINRQSQTDDLSMPRYYGKSELFVAGIDRANSRSADAVELNRSDDGGSGSLSMSSDPLGKNRSRNVEKSKRLMNIRTALPPLNLGLIRGNSSANLRERDRDSKERDRSSKSKDSLRV